MKFRKADDLKATYIGERPRQVYSIDLIPDISPAGVAGATQIVVLVDNFSKFVTIGALPDRTSATLAWWLYEHVICLYGKPLMIKSDGGSEFKGLFKELCESLGIRHHTTLPYHP